LILRLSRSEDRRAYLDRRRDLGPREVTSTQRGLQSRGKEWNRRAMSYKLWMKAEIRILQLRRNQQQLEKWKDLPKARRKLSKTQVFILVKLEMWEKNRSVLVQWQSPNQLRVPNQGNLGQVRSQPSIRVSKMRIILITIAPKKQVPRHVASKTRSLPRARHPTSIQRKALKANPLQKLELVQWIHDTPLWMQMSLRRLLSSIVWSPTPA
jgi:hypothetical protein